MPQAAPSACPHPRCGRLKGSCPDHDRAPRDRPHRPTTTQRGYDGRWQRLVAAAKKRQRAELGYAYCVDCGVDEDTAKATDNPLTGDHLRWPAVSIDDVEIVCRRDNSKRGDLRSGVSGP